MRFLSQLCCLTSLLYFNYFSTHTSFQWSKNAAKSVINSIILCIISLIYIINTDEQLIETEAGRLNAKQMENLNFLNRI